jgi:cytochrome bd ubiquinol oxidase subunit II
MDLNSIWFILIAILYIGYFILEGFDFGVGILHPFVAKTDTERRMVINTIGPHWDGNEVWLITAGGATFAAFPNWYATLFSGFYLPLFLMLVALIIRGVAFEFRSKDDDPRWRALWDWSIFTGSLIPAVLWGVAFANFVRGVPIDASQNYVGGFWNLLNPYALAAGVLTALGFTLQGAIFLALKAEAPIRSRVQSLMLRLWIPSVVVLVAVIGFTYSQTDILTKLGVNPGVIPIGAVLASFITGYFVYRKQSGWAFVMNSLAIALTIITVFLQLYPRVMVSSLNSEWSLTIYNASSSPYTLQVMTIIAVIFVPIVLVYQGWTYWVFRKRVSNNPEKLVY